MQRKINYFLFAILILFTSTLGWAANPPSGSISSAGSSLNWSGGPLTGVSLSPSLCVESISCDTFILQVAIPSNKVAQVLFRISWEDATHDLDLYIFDSEGVEVGSSTSGDQSLEQVGISALRAGVYRVVTNAFVSANTVYSGTITLEAIADPPSEAPLDLSSKIVFGNNTMVDFSAVSGEPFIRSDLKNNIFVSAPFGVSTTVSLLWKSPDGGRTYTALGTPIVRDAVVAPGGGDTHQDFDGSNYLYYVDLSAACVTAAVSLDEGNTFPAERTNSLACVSEENPDAAGDDRQWVGGFGDGIAYVTWRNLAGSSFWMFKTTNAGQSWDNGRLLGEVDQSGPFQVDKKKRPVLIGGVQKNAIMSYQVFYRGTELRMFRVADPNDGTPLLIEDVAIVNPGASVSNVFPILTIDTEGNLYAVWSQTAAEIHMATSINRGQTWSKPVRVSNLSGTNIMPWAVAGDAGRINIVWYRSPVKGNPDVEESTWEIFMAQSVNALKSKPSFQLAKVSQNIIHRGEICLQGLNCDVSVPMRDRSFLEFPSITIDTKGAAVITYNDNTNQVEAPYIMTAKQIAGPSLLKSVGTLPAGSAPQNSDNDESGDARFPDHGAATGANVPALDIKSVSMKNDAAALTVTMELADLSPVALNTAAAQTGGDGVLYLVQWDYNDDIYWVAAEVRGGAAVYHTGTLGIIRSGTSKKFITYNSDAVKSLELQGQISASPVGNGKITIRVPRTVIGTPAPSTKLFSATAYTLSQRGPLVPVGSDAVPNPTGLPVKIDASGAFTYTVVSQ